MAQRKKPSVDSAQVEADARSALTREGAIKLTSLKPVQVREALTAKLAADGFEVTESFVRKPLRTQLGEALAHGAIVPVKSLATYIRGAKSAELKTLLDDAIRDGAARRIVRGAAEAIVGPELKALSTAELQELRSKVGTLSKALEKVTRKGTATLLASDAADALSEALRAIQRDPSTKPATATKPGDQAMKALLEAVDSSRDVRTGLSFVPTVVGRLAPQLDTGAAIQLLLRAAERELLELRPEGGIGRLSDAELSACPAGPHGTRLSWARRLTGGAT